MTDVSLSFWKRMNTGVEKHYERNCGTVKIGSRLPFTNDMYSMSYLATEEGEANCLRSHAAVTCDSMYCSTHSSFIDYIVGAQRSWQHTVNSRVSIQNCEFWC